ncbi:Succinate-semialdehyde dehydrogenase [NADP(+)], partial [Colletotrichum shisoi]
MADVFAKLQDKSLLVTSGLVAGERKTGRDGKTFPVYEPLQRDVQRKGSANFHESTTATEREALLRKWCDLVIANADDLALILALAAGIRRIPSDMIHVVPARDREASMELANNPVEKKLSFTGSTGVGKMLTKAAAGTMKRAVEGALICKLRCSGQTCVCANRLLVHEKVQDEFIEKLVKRVKQDPSSTPPSSRRSTPTSKTRALKKGAVLHTGGKAPGGSKYGLAEHQNI